MPLRVQCSAGHLMMVPDHRAGTTLRCPNCGIDVQVPAAAGVSGKELPKPRVGPTITPPKIGGTAGRQSAQVAGHSTAAKSGIGLPAVKPPPKSRVKPPPLPAAARKAAAPESTEAPATSEPISVPLAAVIVTPEPIAPEPSAPISAEVVIATPEIIAPAPAPPKPIEPTPKVADPALVETVELPPKKIAKADPVKRESPVSRRSLTGTVIEEARPRVDIEPEPPPVAAAAAIAPPRVEPAWEPEAKLKPLAAPEFDPLPPPILLTQGVQATASQRFTAWQLAAALTAAALLSIGPSVWEIADYLRSDSGLAVASWAFLLLMLGVVQLASIVLLVQVPDWSSVWIVTLQSLVLAAIYAAILGLTIITNGDSSLVSTLQLDQQYSTGKAPPWCVCLAATYACIAFFAGRISGKWHKVLRQVQAAEQSMAHT